MTVNTHATTTIELRFCLKSIMTVLPEVHRSINEHYRAGLRCWNGGGASKREIDSYRLSYPPADDREQKRLGQKALEKPSYILASCLIQRPDADVVNPGREANLRTPFLREADGANP